MLLCHGQNHSVISNGAAEPEQPVSLTRRTGPGDDDVRGVACRDPLRPLGAGQYIIVAIRETALANGNYRMYIRNHRLAGFPAYFSVYLELGFLGFMWPGVQEYPLFEIRLLCV